MSLKQITNSAFCALPFIEKYKPTGKTDEYYCCWSKLPIIDRKKEMQSIYKGEKIDQCKSCYLLEEKNVISPRQRETVKWLKDSDVKHYLENWTIDGEQKVFFYDLRYSNKCNLACISCGPKASSLWAKELGIEIVKNDIPEVSVDEIVNSKKIYMAGGEPFLIDEFIKIIKLVASQETQPEIVINTNLTRITDELIDYLSKIKKLNLVISVDSHGSVNEYHRWPMSWNKFINNLESISDIDCYKSFNSVVNAVTILNIGKLTQLENYIDQWSITVSTYPESLNLVNLPEKFKPIARDSIKDLESSKFYKIDVEFKKKVDYLLDICDQSTGNSELLNSYIKEIDIRRNLNHEDYLGVKLF